MTEARIEEGTVTEIVGDECVVRLQPDDEEKCRQCGLCVRAAQAGEERCTLRLPLPGSVRVGSPVRVQISEPGRATAALALFGIPLAAILLGAGAGALLARWTSWPPVIVAVCGVCLALAGAVVAIRKLEGRWKAQGAFSARIIADEGATNRMTDSPPTSNQAANGKG